MGTNLRYLLKKKIWIPFLVVCAIAVYLFVYNRPIELQKATLMSTPVMYREGLTRPYTQLPNDIEAPNINVFYATDRLPTDASIINPLFYGNDRSMNLFLGQATVRFGDEDMQWAAIEEASLSKKRDRVSTDILLNLKYGSNSSQRGLFRPEDGTVWVFPENYPENIKNLIRR